MPYGFLESPSGSFPFVFTERQQDILGVLGIPPVPVPIRQTFWGVLFFLVFSSVFFCSLFFFFFRVLGVGEAHEELDHRGRAGTALLGPSAHRVGVDPLRGLKSGSGFGRLAFFFNVFFASAWGCVCVWGV